MIIWAVAMRPVRPIAYRRRRGALRLATACSERSSFHAAPNSTFADGAGELSAAVTGEVWIPPPAQHQLCAHLELELVELVRRLRASWLAGPALLWDAAYPLPRCARSEAESRLANTLTSGFLQFSQLLAGFELLVWELKDSGAVSEQRILSLEQVLARSRYPFRDQADLAPPS